MDERYLLVRTPMGEMRVELGADPVTVGRSAENVVPLEDEQASRFHCAIEKVREGYQLRDLGSRNGTRVNGLPIKAVVLMGGDVITVGVTEIRVVLPGKAAGGVPRVVPKAPALEEVLEIDPSAVVEEEVLELDASQIVPEIEARARPVETDLNDPEMVLRRMADAIPEHPFEDNQIVMINARGGLAHPAVTGSRRKEAGDAVPLFRALLLVCFRCRASDIHIEPKEHGFQVRLRVDGQMLDTVQLSQDLGTRTMAMVKVLADIDIAQRNIVQEGHFSTRVPAAPEDRSEDELRRVDYRVSFAPSVFGQKLVIRIQDTMHAPARINDLRLPSWMAEELHRVVELDAGMVLAVGPTGSGKTTTLYALLRSLNVNDRNVVTLEDPVEIQIDGITQLPVSEQPGKGFLDLLRSVLRQDPDVILVGEVRDRETAQAAMQAAITGHLVFSTLHTKDSIGTIFRLLDLGVEPYMLVQGLHTVLAQRLVRQLCPHCKKPLAPTAPQVATLAEHGLKAQRVFVPQGCPQCLRTGFLGRRAIFELLTVTDELRDAITKSPSLKDVQAAVMAARFVRLQTSAYDLVVKGVLPFDEVERAMSK